MHDGRYDVCFRSLLHHPPKGGLGPIGFGDLAATDGLDKDMDSLLKEHAEWQASLNGQRHACKTGGSDPGNAGGEAAGAASAGDRTRSDVFLHAVVCFVVVCRLVVVD